MNQGSDQRPETIIGDVTTKLAEGSKAPRDNEPNVRGRAEIRVDEDSEVAHCRHGLTATPAMLTGATESDEERRADAHHITSVLSAFSWRRVERIQSAMAVEQAETLCYYNSTGYGVIWNKFSESEYRDYTSKFICYQYFATTYG